MATAEQKAYQRAWYLAHRDEVIARSKARAAAKAEELRAYHQDYQARNRERLNAKAKAYYEVHRDERLAYQVEYNATHGDALKEYKRQWQAANRDRIKAEKAVKYAAHREEVLAQCKAKYHESGQYKTNPGYREAVKARARAYRQANPEKARAAVVKWCEANRDRLNAAKRAFVRRDYAAHPEKYLERRARRRARERNTSDVERIDYQRILDESQGMCGICHGALGDARFHFDHIIPLAMGGTHTTGNIQIAHSACNLKKGARLG
jgi:5-methylcytosine-specific restriction endonuclease McrA